MFLWKKKSKPENRRKGRGKSNIYSEWDSIGVRLRWFSRRLLCSCGISDLHRNSRTLRLLLPCTESEYRTSARVNPAKTTQALFGCILKSSSEDNCCHCKDGDKTIKMSESTSISSAQECSQVLYLQTEARTSWHLWDDCGSPLLNRVKIGKCWCSSGTQSTW